MQAGFWLVFDDIWALSLTGLYTLVKIVEK